MIEGVQFSSRGGAVTEFEVRLLAESKSDSPWVTVAQRLMVTLGPKIGGQAFAVVLDELGPGRLNTPSRRQFFRSLWQKDRDALIVNLASRPEQDWSYADIGRALGVSREYVRKLVTRQPAGATKAGAP